VISNDFFRFTLLLLISKLICLHLKTLPMKTIVRIYKQNPVVALILNSIAVFLWAATVIFIMTVLAVAFTG